MLVSDHKKSLNNVQEELQKENPDYLFIADCLSWYSDPANNHIITKSQDQKAGNLLKQAKERFNKDFATLYKRVIGHYRADDLTFTERINRMKELRTSHLDPDLPNDFYRENFGYEIRERFEFLAEKLDELEEDRHWDVKLSLLDAHFAYYEHRPRLPEFYRHNNDLLRHLKHHLPGDPLLQQLSLKFEQWKEDDQIAKEIQTIKQQGDISALFDKWDQLLRASEHNRDAQDIINSWLRDLTNQCFETIQENIKKATGLSINAVPADGYILNGQYTPSQLYKYFLRAWLYFDPLQRRLDNDVREFLGDLDDPIPENLREAKGTPDIRLLQHHQQVQWEKARNITERYKAFLWKAEQTVYHIETKSIDPHPALDYLYNVLMPSYSPIPESIRTIAHFVVWRVINEYKAQYKHWTSDHALLMKLTEAEVNQQIENMRSSLIMQKPRYPTQKHIDELNEVISNVRRLPSFIENASKRREDVEIAWSRLSEYIKADDLASAETYFNALERRRREGLYYLSPSERRNLHNDMARYWCLERQDHSRYSLVKAKNDFNSKGRYDAVLLGRIKMWLEYKQDELGHETAWQTLYTAVIEELNWFDHN